MIRLFFSLLFVFTIGCTSGKGVYWCGDHPCINKKEKEAYFKKTMIVEVKNIKKSTFQKKSESEKIIEIAKKSEKKRIQNEKDLGKQAKLDEKRKAKEEKELVKQAKLDKKRRMQEEKELAKQIELDEENLSNQEVESINETNNDDLNKIVKTLESKQSKDTSTSFKDLVDMITKKSNLKPFPDINETPK
jgi:hypothetical protein